MQKRPDTWAMVRKSKQKETSVLGKAFGEQLRKLREERHLSQRELAEGISIETAQISRYERGVVLPNAESLLALATFLRVSVGLLLGQKDDVAAAADQPISDISLLERFRDLERLDRKDREVAIAVIDALIASRQFEEVAERRSRRSA